MKYLCLIIAAAAVIAHVEAASAQMTYQPVELQPMPSWMQDTGGTTDHPVHMPGDRSADALNAQYRNGIAAPYGSGFPAPYYIPR
jgi:hypothetical protein